MTSPRLNLLPLRPGVAADAPTHLDLVLRVSAPQPAVKSERAPLNLALVLDRSGSMSGEPLQNAKRAAEYAVGQLLPKDRVSVVAYDNTVSVVMPSTLASDKLAIISAIRGIRNGGTTALHAGWLEGATQVSRHLDSKRLNRVVLLSDGLANVGEQNPDMIAGDVAGLQQRGVSTTTLGLGYNFNEDLMQAMAVSGGGNFYFIESSEQLPDIFHQELRGLGATFGTNVRLRFDSLLGTELTELLNDLGTDDEGALVLPDLIVGIPIEFAASLRVPPKVEGHTIGELHLSWDDPATGERQDLSYTFDLPAYPNADALRLPADSEVAGVFAELRAAREKAAAVVALDAGDYAGMQERLSSAREKIMSAPPSARREAEIANLTSLDHAVRAGDHRVTRKRMRDQVYRKQWSKGALSEMGDIEVVLGDLLQQQVDALVNPTNEALYGMQGIDGAIHRAGGPELTLACRKIGRCTPGEAVHTDGYELLATSVIHTVGPKWRGGKSGEAEVLARCYRNSLALAVQLQAKTVALPAIGTGHNGVPTDTAATIAFREIQAFLEREPALELRIVLYDQATFDTYNRVCKTFTRRSNREP